MKKKDKIKIKKHSLYIQPGVYDKINHLHKRISTEWSGIIFYKILNGCFEKNEPLEMEVVDILLKDVGSSVFTDFEFTPDIVSYQVNNNLLEHRVGMIHSHHNMQAYFSKTDDENIEEVCSDFDFFLSLVVNYDDKPVAKIGYETESEEKTYKNIFGGKKIYIGEKSYITTTMEEVDVIFDTPEWVEKLDKEVEKIQNSKKLQRTLGFSEKYQNFNNSSKNMYGLNFKENKQIEEQELEDEGDMSIYSDTLFLNGTHPVIHDEEELELLFGKAFKIMKHDILSNLNTPIEVFDFIVENYLGVTLADNVEPSPNELVEHVLDGYIALFKQLDMIDKNEKIKNLVCLKAFFDGIKNNKNYKKS